MQYIADIIIVAIIITGTIAGIRKGFIKSVFDFIGAILSAILAATFSNPISHFIFDTIVKDGLHERILTSLERSSEKLAIMEVFEKLPPFLINLLEDQNITQAGLIESANGTTEQTATAVVAAIAPAIILVINFFVVIFLFILFIIIIRLLSKILDKIFEFPVLSQINDLLGGVFGFAFSAVLVFVVIAIIMFTGELISPVIMGKVNEALDNSIITGIIVNSNPFEWIFG